MDNSFKIFAVDDDEMILASICAILATDYSVTTFASAEACLAHLETEHPNMFLLDVALPGMNGYDLCRKLKADERWSAIPVTFVSSFDTVDARLNGYDAGGQDFVVKPFDPEEIRRKAKVAQQIAESQFSQESKTQEARYLASLVMANMDESGYLISFMRNLIGLDSEQDVASSILELTQKYGLDSVVQTRTGQQVQTLSAAGRNLPLETSVLNHVRNLDRIFEFRQRSAFNYRFITLMINNMPLHDPDFCGRLRDHLCIAVEAADARIRALELEYQNAMNQTMIRSALEAISSTISMLQKEHQQSRTSSSELLFSMDQSLTKSFVHLGLTEGQERFLSELVNDFLAQLITSLDRGEETHQMLYKLSGQLASQLKN